MSPVSVRNAPSRSFQRPTSSPDGNTTWTTLRSVRAVVSLDAPSTEAGTGPRYTQTGKVFVPRGSDVAAGDRFDYGGYLYTLTAVVRADTRHPISGRDLGWMVYTISGGQTKWT